MDQFIRSVAPSIMSSLFSGVIVSLITLWQAGRQRAGQERRSGRNQILAGIGREPQGNRTATRELDSSDAHFKIGSLATVAFERRGAELVAIAPDSVDLVFKHYAAVGTAREGIRSLAAPPNREADECCSANGSTCRIRLAPECATRRPKP